MTGGAKVGTGRWVVVVVLSVGVTNLKSQLNVDMMVVTFTTTAVEGAPRFGGEDPLVRTALEGVTMTTT